MCMSYYTKFGYYFNKNTPTTAIIPARSFLARLLFSLRRKIPAITVIIVESCIMGITCVTSAKTKAFNPKKYAIKLKNDRRTIFQENF